MNTPSSTFSKAWLKYLSAIVLAAAAPVFAADTVEEAIQLHNRGVSDEIVVEWASQQPPIEVTRRNLDLLTEAKLSKEVLNALVLGNTAKPKPGVKAPARAAAAPAPAQPDETRIGAAAPVIADPNPPAELSAPNSVVVVPSYYGDYYGGYDSGLYGNYGYYGYAWPRYWYWPHYYGHNGWSSGWSHGGNHGGSGGWNPGQNHWPHNATPNGYVSGSATRGSSGTVQRGGERQNYTSLPHSSTQPSAQSPRYSAPSPSPSTHAGSGYSSGRAYGGSGYGGGHGYGGGGYSGGHSFGGGGGHHR